MAIYKNITTNANDHITTLIQKNGTHSGGISKISICNNDSLQAENISVYIEDEATTKYYMIKNVDIPVGVTLVLDDVTSFDSRRNSLNIVTNKDSGTGAPDVSVIVK